MFADLLDSIVLGFLGYAIGYPFRYALSAMGLQALWVGLVCSFLYFGILHTRIGGGQTLGKRWLGIQVLKRDGSFLGLKSSLIRYLAISVIFYNGLFGSLFALLPTKLGMALGSVFLLGVVWAFFACYLLIPLHPLRRGLHDLAAGSVVVYEGCYDGAAIAALEDSAKVKRALWILSGGTVLVAALVVAGFASLQRSAQFHELSALSEKLRSDYDVRGVKEWSVRGGEPTLSVEVYLPMARYEDQTERERVRDNVYERVQKYALNLRHYPAIRIVLVSGFNLGIARMQLNDPGKPFPGT